jgi:hypothetical protein
MEPFQVTPPASFPRRRSLCRPWFYAVSPFQVDTIGVGSTATCSVKGCLTALAHAAGDYRCGSSCAALHAQKETLVTSHWFRRPWDPFLLIPLNRTLRHTMPRTFWGVPNPAFHWQLFWSSSTLPCTMSCHSIP